jgi:dihydropteroate synthase
LGRFELPAHRPLVMGILNVTPDSFSDGGLHVRLDQAVQAAQRMKADGAEVIDVGGESTRPGAQPVSPAQEADRVLPVLRALQSLGLPLSLDSRRPEVVEQALSIGIDMVNDVSGFRDPAMRALAPSLAAQGVSVCVMHMQGEPQTMQANPQYGNVVQEVRSDLLEQRRRLEAAGLPRSHIWLDPGFGFGKTTEHNLALLRGLSSLVAEGPVLVGLSRKRMLAALTEREDAPAERLGGSLAAALAAAQAGAQLLRVHDVKATVDFFRALGAIH